MMNDILHNKKRHFVSFLFNWHSINKRNFSWRNTSDPYKIGTAEILLQKTNADKIEPVFNNIIKTFPSQELLSNANKKDVEYYLKDIGLFNRSSTLIDYASYLKYCKENNIAIGVDGLLSIKGVGLYIANSIMVHTLDMHLPLLDTNILRIYSRVFGIKSNLKRPRTDKKLWHNAVHLLPDTDISSYYYALLDFGALVCKTKPLCSACFMQNIPCLYKSNCSGSN